MRLAELEVLDIGYKIASALDMALKHNLLHRDIKPGNILFDADGEPKLIDFGLARSVEAEPESCIRDRRHPLLCRPGEDQAGARDLPCRTCTAWAARFIMR